MKHSKSPYFIAEPQWVVRDRTGSAEAVLRPEEKRQIKTSLLEKYFNDVYKLFLMHLSRYDAMPNVSEEENKKLRALLEELINVKTLLAEEK